MAVDSSIQRISRLTPLPAVLALIDRRVQPVTPRGCSLASARHRVLAEDVVVGQCPPAPIALRDGFAVDAGALADAGPYSPVRFLAEPRRVDVGDAVPAGADAVAPLDALSRRGDRLEAIAAVSPGDGLLAAGADAAAHTTVRRAGEILRDIDIAILAAAGRRDVTVRDPRIRIACGSVPKTPLVEAALDLIAHAATAAGAMAAEVDSTPDRLYGSLSEAGADAGLVIGGTGSGRADASVQALWRLGHVEAHGIAIAPGETAAFGFAGTRPVLLMPGRLDAVLAVWLLIGRHLVARLAGTAVTDTTVVLPLKRKISSTIGLTELIPVRCAGGMAEPLGAGYLSFQMLTRSDGWISIPADSEGFAAGTEVGVKPWP